MPITNGYCTLSDVKGALRIDALDTGDDALIENAITSASRRIDGYCGRFFYKTGSTAVTMFPVNEILCVFENDLATDTATIAIDTVGNGTYSTTLVLNTDYILEPTNAALQGRPYRQALMVGGQSFPLQTIYAFPTVKVTGLWGWNAVPSDVQQACVLLAMRQFARLNAALGVVGFADMALQVRAVDPDVRDLLSPYRLFGVS
jgi:hypothetical protein